MIQVCLSILFIRSLLFYWISTPHGTVIPPLHSLTAPLHCSLLTFLAFPSTSFLLGAINVDLYRDLPVLRGVFGSDAELAGAVHNSVRHYRHNYSVEPTLYFHNLLGLVVFGGVFGGGVVSRGWELWKRAQAARTEPGVGGLLKSVRNVGKISDYLIIASSFLVFGLYVTDILPPFLKIVDNPDLPYGELEEATIELAGGHAWAYPALWVSTVAFCWEIWGQLSGKGKEA